MAKLLNERDEHHLQRARLGIRKTALCKSVVSGRTCVSEASAELGSNFSSIQMMRGTLGALSASTKACS